MKKLSFLFLVALTVMLSSCSGEFWQGVAMGGASFLSGMSSGYLAPVPTVPVSPAPVNDWSSFSVIGTASSYDSWSGGTAYAGTSSYGYSSTTPSSSSTTPSSTSSASSSSHTCPLCHGKGTIVRESYTSTFGNDQKKYCSTCGQSFWQSSGHSHITCTQCHGKGSF